MTEGKAVNRQFRRYLNVHAYVMHTLSSYTTLFQVERGNGLAQKTLTEREGRKKCGLGLAQRREEEARQAKVNYFP